MQSKKYWLYLIAILFFFSQCTKQSQCLRYANIVATVGFKKNIDTLPALDTLLPNPILVFDSFYIINIDKAQMQFLMKSTADSMQFTIAADSTTNLLDTIHLYYNRELNFVNKECGYNYFYNMYKIVTTKNQIKQASIITTQVNDNLNVQHINLFY